MTLLIDAYNVLHVEGVLPPDLAGIDLDELASLITGSRFRHDTAILVCDGRPRRHAVETPSVHVRFAGPGVTADSAIIRLVRRSTSPKRLTVVTSDREIVQHVRRRRVQVLSSEQFLAAMVEDHAVRPPTPAADRRAVHPADRRQVEAWLRIFDLDASMLDHQASTTASRPTRGPQPGRPTRSTDDSADAGSPPTARTEDRPARASHEAEPGTRSILDARTLADIDPASIDELDVERLLPPDPPPPRGRGSEPPRA